MRPSGGSSVLPLVGQRGRAGRAPRCCFHGAPARRLQRPLPRARRLSAGVRRHVGDRGRYGPTGEGAAAPDVERCCSGARIRTSTRSSKVNGAAVTPPRKGSIPGPRIRANPLYTGRSYGLQSSERGGRSRWMLRRSRGTTRRSDDRDACFPQLGQSNIPDIPRLCSFESS